MSALSQGQIRERRELARRASHGSEVALLWDKAANAVVIELLDTRSGASVEFEVDPSTALDAFNHPYAYAASRDLRVRISGANRIRALAKHGTG